MTRLSPSQSAVPYRVSVIVRTLNEEKYIEATLAAVRAQKGEFTIELVVIDSGSTDRTIEIASHYADQIHHIQHFSYGSALNIGCQKASGDFLVLLSADATPCTDFWLGYLLSPFKNRNVVGVFGREIPRSNAHPSYKRLITETFESPPKAMFTSSNSVIRKSVWEENKYDEDLPVSEDYQWAQRVRKIGGIIIYSKDATVWHSHVFSPVHLFRRMSREFNIAARLRKDRFVSRQSLICSSIFLILRGHWEFAFSIYRDFRFNRWALSNLIGIIMFEAIILAAYYAAGASLIFESRSKVLTTRRFKNDAF